MFRCAGIPGPVGREPLEQSVILAPSFEMCLSDFTLGEGKGESLPLLHAVF